MLKEIGFEKLPLNVTVIFNHHPESASPYRMIKEHFLPLWCFATHW